MKAIQMEEATSYRNVDGAQYENARTHTHTHRVHGARDHRKGIVRERHEKQSKYTTKLHTNTHTHKSSASKWNTGKARRNTVFFLSAFMCAKTSRFARGTYEYETVILYTYR